MSLRLPFLASELAIAKAVQKLMRACASRMTDGAASVFMTAPGSKFIAICRYEGNLNHRDAVTKATMRFL